MIKNLNYDKFKIFRGSLNVTFNDLQTSQATKLSKQQKTKWFEGWLQSKEYHYREIRDKDLEWVLSKIKDAKVKEVLHHCINSLQPADDCRQCNYPRLQKSHWITY